MSNPHRGEVSLPVGSQTYTLRFSTNALCELEEATGLGVNAIAAQLTSAEGVRLKMLRALLWAGLQDHHPDVTQAQAGEIMDDAGKVLTFEKLGEAFQLAFPADDGGGAKGANGSRPPKAGVGSKSSPAIPKQD